MVYNAHSCANVLMTIFRLGYSLFNVDTDEPYDMSLVSRAYLNAAAVVVGRERKRTPIFGW
jgi:hypothetical protein